jgi:hypothetical protein
MHCKSSAFYAFETSSTTSINVCDQFGKNPPKMQDISSGSRPNTSIRKFTILLFASFYFIGVLLIEY